ncbi:hypothetical protein ACHAWU_005253 [Discostella pseudostelligera]|uniref:Transcription factor TFIIIC triple barrel domain-containing protein n=1 Tax=Discostella pseudostelligera TaxID=259834 RepID=A0ABD3M4T7_9STRA
MPSSLEDEAKLPAEHAAAASASASSAAAAASSTTAAASSSSAAAARGGGVKYDDDFDHYNDDHDEDLDFDPSASDDDDDDDDEQDDDDDDEEEDYDEDYEEAAAATSNDDPVILEGSIYLNDMGKIIFTGTWCLNSQLPSKSTENGNNNKGDGVLSDERRQKQTFRLESQNTFTAPPNPSSIVNELGPAIENNSGILHEYERMNAEEAKIKAPNMFDSAGNIKESILAKMNGPRNAFDVRYPTMDRLGTFDGVLPKNAYITERRSPILFDGYFIEPNDSNNSDKKKKVKESNVSIIFSLDEMQFDNPQRYDINGSGMNEYGAFQIDGSYYIPGQEGDCKSGMASVWCSKTYTFYSGGGGGAKARRKRGGKKNNDDDDDDDDDDALLEKADYAEVGELYEDATMSIEDLRRKYYGGGGSGAGDDGMDDDADDDGGGKMPAVKKSRPSPAKDDSDDDDCGF